MKLAILVGQLAGRKVSLVFGGEFQHTSWNVDLWMFMMACRVPGHSRGWSSLSPFRWPSNDPPGCWHGAMVGKDGDGLWASAGLRHWILVADAFMSPTSGSRNYRSHPSSFFFAAWDVKLPTGGGHNDFPHVWGGDVYLSAGNLGQVTYHLDVRWTARPWQSLRSIGLRWGWMSYLLIYQGICHTWLRSSSFLRQLSENPLGFVPDSQITLVQGDVGTWHSWMKRCGKERVDWGKIVLRRYPVGANFEFESISIALPGYF